MTSRPAQATAAAFRAAVERGDVTAVLDTLAPDVVFNSPIVHAPYVGRTALAPLLAAVVAVFVHFHYTREVTAPHRPAPQLQTRICERKVEGSDILLVNGAGPADELEVVGRPYSSSPALLQSIAP